MSKNIPLSRDTWFYIAHFLNKNDIACVKASCKTLDNWLCDHPRLAVDKISYSFWNYLIEELINEEDGCDDYCVFIESIDRGVKSFAQFAKRLKAAYPNIKELDFEQNYSCGVSRELSSKHWENDFIFFIRYLGLTYLKIEDTQSNFFRYLNWDNILDAMPDRSEYILLFDRLECDCFNCDVNYKDIIGNKCFKIKTRGTKKLVIHGDEHFK